MVANFHGSETLRGVKIRIPEDARNFLGRSGDGTWTFTDRLASDWIGSVSGKPLENEGIALLDLAPCSAMVLEIGTLKK